MHAMDDSGVASAMNAGQERRKLPVPGPWQVAAIAAMEALADSRSVTLDAVALTRAQVDSSDPESLEVWMISGGAGYRYRSRLDGGLAEPLAS